MIYCATRLLLFSPPPMNDFYTYVYVIRTTHVDCGPDYFVLFLLSTTHTIYLIQLAKVGVCDFLSTFFSVGRCRLSTVVIYLAWYMSRASAVNARFVNACE